MQQLFDLLQARSLAHTGNTAQRNKDILDDLIEKELNTLRGTVATLHAIRPDTPPSIPS